MERKKRVAAYARVSSGKDAMLHSLSAQISYYNELIQKERDWEYVGVYSDEAITGTKEDRAGFQKMIEDAVNGKVDMIITKSISRFARNTVTLLETVRMLKGLGVDVYFEEQNIHTTSADGELMLTILASYAQEESRSVSENMKWRIKKNFEEGLPWNGGMLGYRLHNGQFTIVPEEAAIVRRIFDDYLAGKGINAIANALTEENLSTRLGNVWHTSTVGKILRNYTYTGNLLLQRTFRENHITKKSMVNHGELPQYHVGDAHEPIISIEMFNQVQAEIERRAAKYAHISEVTKRYPFSGLVVCANCGKSFRRKVTATQPVWICATYNTKGKKYCASKQIPESTLAQITSETVADISEIEKIVAEVGNILTFYLRNGQTVKRHWEDRSRSESWTPEMRAAAGKRKRERSS